MKLKLENTGTIMDLQGCLPKPDRVVTIEEMDQAIGDAIAEDWERFERQVQEDRLSQLQEKAHSRDAKSNGE